MQISKTSKKILKVIFTYPNKDFYINELIRETRLLPNAVYQALKTLFHQKILEFYQSGQRKFFHLNNKYSDLQILKELVLKDQRSSFKNSQTEWIKILNRQSSYSFSAALCASNFIDLKQIYGIAMPTFWYNDVTFGVYYPKEELVSLGKAISAKIELDSNFAQNDIDLCTRSCNLLVNEAKKIPLIALVDKSNRQLADILKRFYRLYLRAFPFVTSPHAIERYFEQKIRQKVNDEKTLEILLTPISNTDEERDAALDIAAYIKKKGTDKTSKKLIEKHWENYCWLPLWSIYAKPLTIEYFEREINNMLEKVKNPEKELKRFKSEEDQARKKVIKVFRKIRASLNLINEVKLLQEYIYLRVFRKNAISQSQYYLLPLLAESANRFGLTLEEIKLLSFEEVILGLLNKLSLIKIKKIVQDRKKGWAMLMQNGKIKTICGVKEIIEAMERYRIIAPTSAMQRTVKGRVACRGKTIGRVKIVKKLSELNKVEKGDILVSKMTTPDYMMAIHKVSAIVTDEGGVTCHAAIVSREFNIPCITATTNATQILADNDLVEVDAFEGIVRVIEAIEAPENIKIINGRTIYKGRVKGIARIVLDASDFEKVKHGDILIAAQTTPEYLSSLYKVKGFTVDEESLTSHAMLYGRALKLPSIMGTNYARNVINDGDLIELDATRGIINLLKKHDD